MKQRLLNEFINHFDVSNDINVFFAPGRVNLIGEHTDYNGGHVFPCALTMGTYCAIAKRKDGLLRFYSGNFPEAGIIERSLDALTYDKKASWTNYPMGVIWALGEIGMILDCGFDMLVRGNIPNGSGLSSSASLEVLTGYALKQLYDLDVSLVELALVGQRAENAFVGMNCGIMDQFAIAMGKKEHAIFLNTATLVYEYAPIRLDGYSIVIMDTCKKRGLSDSKYNERRAQCEHALFELQQELDIKTLCDLTKEEFELNKHLITDPIERKRAKHAVYENRRTLAAYTLLQQGDIEGFGKLMDQSHTSLQYDYEVTGLELDTLVHTAWEQQGVIGARMTGAGFGGCAVSIIKNDCIERMQENVAKVYNTITGLVAQFYIAAVGGGPTEL